jgi:hypothetical protein
MESTPKTNPHPKPRETDVDLGLVIYKTGNAVNNFFVWIGRMMRKGGNTFLIFLLFIRKNLLWLLLGTLIGFGFGLYLFYKNGAKYYSQMTVKTNFNSGRALYGTIDYLNSMINSNSMNDLAKILDINPAEAGKLVNFEVSPVKSEMITAQMYKEQFLTIHRNTKIRMDTFWTKTLNYNTFKESLTNIDYPVHVITVASTSPTIFSKLQRGLVNQVSNNELLQQIRENEIETNEEEIQLLVASIRSLDTLRNTYNNRLKEMPVENTPGNNVYMLQGTDQVTSPELLLYDKLLELKDELKYAKNRAEVEKNILEVYAPFNHVGKRESIFKQNTTKFSLAGLLAAFAILVLLRIYHRLGEIEKQRKNPG